MRRIAIPALVGLVLLGAAACSPDEKDFKDDAEGFINDDEQVEPGTDISGASCQEPDSTEVGTTFLCTGVGADGVTYEFSVEITGDNTYDVSGGTPAAGSVPPGTAGTATPGTADPAAPADSAPAGTTPATAPPGTG